MTRKQMTFDEVEELWDRYRRGEPAAMLARRFDRTTSGSAATSARRRSDLP